MANLIRATNLWGYDELVRELGGDPRRLLARFHLPVAPERDDESFYPYRNAALLLEATAIELDCPDFGLRLANWQGLEMLGPVAVVARNSETMLDAIQAIARYLYIHCPALVLRMASPPDASSVRFDYRITELPFSQIRQSYELSMANCMQMLRMLAGPQARLQVMSFLHQQAGPNEAYARTFGCRVRFGQDWCGWQMSETLAHKPVDHADAQTRHCATAYLESRYPPGATSVSARVTELIRRLLPTGQCNSRTVAAELSMHPRTLHRRLAEEGARYEELLDSERRQQAEQYLSNPGLHLVQIAGLLGYTEQSALNRSCRRWFGTTPRKHRERLQTARH